MKKLILLILLTTSIVNSQDFKTEEKSVIGVFECDSLSKSDIFSSINKWISINYNSSKNVIQMNDLASGTIIIKGVNVLKHKNTNKIFYPNNNLVTEYSTSLLNHLIEINVKENKFRIIYKIIDIETQGIGLNNLLFECINFNGLDDSLIQKYNDIMDAKLKSNLTGKQKRMEFTEMTKPSLEEININLINDIKITMLSIQKSIKKSEKDNW